MRKIYETVESIEIISEEKGLQLKYLELLRLQLRNLYPDGQKSKPYFYETVLRRHFDAVAILLFERRKDDFYVYLRRTLRPSLAIREYVCQGRKKGLLNLPEKPVLLEVIAGILEGGDDSDEAIRKRALAEVFEEGGIRLEEKDLKPLGQAILPTPGMNPERIHLFAAELHQFSPQIPPGDGSPVEEVTGLVCLSLTEALKACLQGKIRDAKTEISLHRLQALSL